MELAPWLSAGEIARRRQAGHQCLLGWHGQELVYHRWYTTEPAFLAYLGLTIQPRAGDLVSIDAYTSPRVRDQGVHTEGLKVMLDWASARGLQRDIALVARWNGPSLRAAIDKAGRRSIGSVQRWRLGRWCRYQTRGAVTLDQAGRLQIAQLPGL